MRLASIQGLDSAFRLMHAKRSKCLNPSEMHSGRTYIRKEALLSGQFRYDSSLHTAKLMLYYVRLGSFADHLTDKDANKLYSDFNANKIRQRVNDHVVAEKLIPKNHGFGTRRLPLETNYFEVYNDPRVRLVDFTADSPIKEITPKGVVLESGDEIELDVLVYATGFDAITGSLTRGIDLRGKDGLSLTEAWEDGIKTFLGLFVKEFPNMAMIMGPHQV